MCAVQYLERFSQHRYDWGLGNQRRAMKLSRVKYEFVFKIRVIPTRYNITGSNGIGIPIFGFCPRVNY